MYPEIKPSSDESIMPEVTSRWSAYIADMHLLQSRARSIKLSVLFACALVFTNLHAVSAKQDNAYVRTIWNVASGLPENTVQAVVESPIGSLWIGTTGGLTNFGGARLQPYANGVSSPPAVHSAFCLLIARDGTLWAGTEGEGLLHLSGNTIRTYAGAEGLTDGFVRSIIQDDQGRIWAGTDDGLFRMTQDHFERMDASPQLAPLAVHSIVEDRDHRIWAGGSQLVALSPTGAVEVFPLPGAYSQNRVKKILQTSDGAIWVGTVGGLQRLSGGRFHTVPGISATVRALLQTDDGTLWIGTIGDGLWTFRDGRLAHIRDLKLLPSDTILTILEDRYYQMWLGTQAGLVRLDRTPINLVSLPGAGDPDFETISGDDSGNTWVAAQNLYLIRGDAARRIVYPALHGASVRNVYRARNGALWVGTDGSGVYRILADRVTHYTAPAQLTNNFIRGFLESRAGDMWIASDEGVTRIGPDGTHQLTEASGLAFFSTRSLMEDRDGGIWIGTDRGLNLWKNGAFQQNAITHALAHEKVWSILQDHKGALWFGTRDDGLFCAHNGAIMQYTTENGLPENSVYQILQDHAGIFWLSEANIIASFTESQMSLQSAAPHINPTIYSMPSGAEDAQMYGGRQPSGFVADDGSVWFPTSRGAAHITPVAPLSVGPPPQAVLNSFIEDGREIAPELAQRIPAGISRLSFRFSAIYLRPQGSLRFRYRLDGFDKTWIVAGADNAGSYTNLKAGHYTFRLQAFDMAHPADLTEIAVPFVKQPYFYQTWWFYTLCMLLLAAAAGAIYRFRLSQIQARFAAVIEERGRLAREMHDTVIQGCIGVSTLLEAVATRNPTHDELLDYAREQTNSTINEARRALWDMRRDDDLDLVDAIHALVAQAGRDHPSITVTLDAAQPVWAFSSVAHEVLMSVREALYNAIQHSRSDRINVKVEHRRGNITIEVTDFGAGFDPEHLPAGHYGLIGMRERMDRLYGHLHIRSAAGRGTTIKLDFRIVQGAAHRNGK